MLGTILLNFSFFVLLFCLIGACSAAGSADKAGEARDAAAFGRISLVIVLLIVVLWFVS